MSIGAREDKNRGIALLDEKMRWRRNASRIAWTTEKPTYSG
jgi:hypothetical protein